MHAYFRAGHATLPSPATKRLAYLPLVSAARSAWSAQQMTPMTRLLRQSSDLHLSARENTQDVNEAYLVVHQVMTRAIGRAEDHDSDLGAALARALEQRAKRLSASEAAA
jgi:hypothetical protein